jgi:hypothetical protein
MWVYFVGPMCASVSGSFIYLILQKEIRNQYKEAIDHETFVKKQKLNSKICPYSETFKYEE